MVVSEYFSFIVLLKKIPLHSALNIIYEYSVMQSDFCGAVVSDSFNKTYRDEDNILNQICKSKYIRSIIMII